MQPTDVLNLIYAAIDEVNLALPPERQIVKSPETPLFGRSSKLDSLGLVNLIVASEAQIAQATGAAVTLADERAMSQKHSPFRTVGSLSEYAATLLQEAKLAG